MTSATEVHSAVRELEEEREALDSAIESRIEDLDRLTPVSDAIVGDVAVLASRTGAANRLALASRKSDLIEVRAVIARWERALTGAKERRAVVCQDLARLKARAGE